MKIARDIGPQIDSLVNEVFSRYSQELLAQPITYIVAAVWGAGKDGDLTDIQREIHGTIAPVIERIVHSFHMDSDKSAEKYAIGYLARGLIIARITYMIEAVKNYYIKNHPYMKYKDYDIHKTIGNA